MTGQRWELLSTRNDQLEQLRPFVWRSRLERCVLQQFDDIADSPLYSYDIVVSLRTTGANFIAGDQLDDGLHSFGDSAVIYRSLLFLVVENHNAIVGVLKRHGKR